MRKALLLLLIVTGCGITSSEINISMLGCHESREFIEPDEQCLFNSKKEIYRGIWYGQSKIDSKSNYKYAGGLGTYSSHHSPIAIYSSEANKTFFTYGGTREDYSFKNSYSIAPDQLYIMVSYYDHTTKSLANPTLVFDKWTNDPHDNPVLNIDSNGFIWLFVPSHGEMTTPSYILKGKTPYSIDEFEVVEKTLFAYPQPHINEDGNGLLFYTSYETGRTLMFRSIQDNVIDKEEHILSFISKGHYQVSTSNNNKIGTALNYHPRPGGADARTNLYYLELDLKENIWRNIQNETLTLPLHSANNKTLIKDYENEGYLVYIMDIVFDKNENPVILYNISDSYLPDKTVTVRFLKVAYFKDDSWNFKTISETDHNYNMGTIYVNEDSWKIAVPTKAGPQKGSPGGEIELWVSKNEGSSWNSEGVINYDDPFNHNYVRRVVNANSEFAFFWSSGHGFKPSESKLYFSDINGKNTISMP